MSIELHAFIARERIPNRNDWQASIDALGLPLALPADLEPLHHIGYASCLLRGEQSGLELYLERA
jgi:hypothetical protein